VAQQLAVSHPGLRFELQEREPTEVMQLLADDRIDLGFVYDFSLVPRFRDDGGALRFIFAAPLVLAVPTSRTALRLSTHRNGSPPLRTCRGW
jgi:DNA-binding transcriptional LysR family regulator